MKNYLQNLIKKKKYLIVAEAGNNHEGNIKNAYKLIDQAVKGRADAIKFQTFNTEMYVSVNEKIAYKKLKKFQLKPDDFKKLFSYAKKKKIILFSTPFDIKSADYLNKFQNVFKISSGDNNFYDLIKKVCSYKKSLIVSTGLTNLEDIVDIEKNIYRFWKNKDYGLSFTHCVSSYPALADELNLRSIISMNEKTRKNTIIGYSDHSIGIEACYLSYVLGAKVLEKHFTFDKNFSSFRDHHLSANYIDLLNLRKKIEATTIYLGSKNKRIQKSEKLNLSKMRRSYALKRDREKGFLIKKSDLVFIRPKNKYQISDFRKVINKKLKKNKKAFVNLTSKDFL